MSHRTIAASIWCLALILLVYAPTPAHADDIRAVQASGEATNDSESARVQAIDTALAEAVGQVLIDTVAPAARRRWRGQLNTHVVRRARRFVAGFKVLEEGEVENRLRVRIEARVNLARLRAELEELGVLDDENGTGEPRPKLVFLVHESAGDTVWASFGERANRLGPAAKAMENRLSEHGFTLVSTAGQGVPIARELPEGMPLADESAADMALAKGAGGALVMGARAWPDGTIRGTPLVGARARALVRVLDVDRDRVVSLVARIEVESAGYGETDAQAMAQALARAGERALDMLASTLSGYWPPLVSAPDDTLLVEVRGYRAWQEVAALLAGLAATRGVERAWPRQLGSRGLVLAVRSRLERRRVSSIIERIALPDATVEVEERGAGLVVSIGATGAEDDP